MAYWRPQSSQRFHWPLLPPLKPGAWASNQATAYQPTYLSFYLPTYLPSNQPTNRASERANERATNPDRKCVSSSVLMDSRHSTNRPLGLRRVRNIEAAYPQRDNDEQEYLPSNGDCQLAINMLHRISKFR